MSLAMDKSKENDPYMTRSENAQVNSADKLIAWNEVMKIFADKKRAQDKTSGRKIEMALYIHDLKDRQSRTVEFIRSSTANRFINMVTISPLEGHEGPAEEFKWSAADPAASSAEFSEARLARLGRAMDLLGNSLRGTESDGEA